MNNDIKYKLANAMKECMFSSPVEKITVKEICDTCGVTRQTFYRNFQDKYDLINWYFDKILIESFHQMGRLIMYSDTLLTKIARQWMKDWKQPKKSLKVSVWQVLILP